MLKYVILELVDLLLMEKKLKNNVEPQLTLLRKLLKMKVMKVFTQIFGH